METGTHRASNRKSQKDRVVVTSGEVFGDAFIDLLASADSCRPNLFFWNGNREFVARRIRYNGVVYQAPELHPSIGEAIHLPAGLSPFGTADDLFGDLAEKLQEYVGLNEEMAQSLSLWTGTTWLSDVLPSPPLLAIWGPDMSLAMTLFNLLSCVSRRALILAGISRAALVNLPTHLRLTWLINQPDLPRQLWQLCRASNHRGVLVPGKSGAVLDWASSKAIFWGMAPEPNLVSGEALRILLPPADPGLPVLDEWALATIAANFQAHFQAFRLDWLKRKWEEEPSPDLTFPFGGSEVARNLFACVQYEPELVQKVMPLLDSQQAESLARRKLDPNFVTLEVIWDLAHQGGEISVKKITEGFNVALRARGEKWERSEEEVGWILKHLGFERCRNGSGMVLRFSREHVQLVHELVRKSGVDFAKVEGCSDCAEPETVVPAVVQGV